jgi:hypothetical protein
MHRTCAVIEQNVSSPGSAGAAPAAVLIVSSVALSVRHAFLPNARVFSRVRLTCISGGIGGVRLRRDPLKKNPPKEVISRRVLAQSRQFQSFHNADSCRLDPRLWNPAAVPVAAAGTVGQFSGHDTSRAFVRVSWFDFVGRISELFGSDAHTGPPGVARVSRIRLFKAGEQSATPRAVMPLGIVEGGSGLTQRCVAGGTHCWAMWIAI